MDEGQRKLHEPESPAPGAEASQAARRGAEAQPVANAADVAAVTEPIEAEAAETEGSSRGIVGHLQSVAGPVAGAIGSVIEMAAQGVSLGQAVIERRLRRLARDPLPNLYELYPEARLASPHELGFRFVPVEEIRGTAVAGAAQRGGDFLPLRPFRGENWEARWQRIRWAHERLQPLPPVDLIKYEGDYWVVDGHNRVAVTLYANGVGLDAMVTELVPLDGQTSERPRNLLAYLGETGELRAAVQGRRPAMGMRQVEQQSGDEASGLAEGPAPGEAEQRTRDEDADLARRRSDGTGVGGAEGSEPRGSDPQ
ncbi:MAG: hypothetical protein ABSE58_01060 [Candidatus Limnocylindrales bacterium]|jgi:hypothetical protein